jgi:hypothetical protein
MNKPTPKFNPFCTAFVWLPKYVPSDITSLNHKLITYITLNTANGTKYSNPSNPCINKTVAVVNTNNEILVNNGHGEGDTK